MFACLWVGVCGGDSSEDSELPCSWLVLRWFACFSRFEGFYLISGGEIGGDYFF